MAELRAVVYMSQGIWVTKCPRAWCVHVDHFGPGPNTGRVGGLTEKLWHCFRCQLVCEAQWPESPTDIEAIVGQRPMPETRNWLPGEDLEQLIAENVVHGLIAPELLHRQILAVDGRLTQALRDIVAVRPQMELVTAGARAIGAGA